ncbi:hypothetical protein TSAR_008365, partial [Trichomalopsis sarcophagae]
MTRELEEKKIGGKLLCRTNLSSAALGKTKETYIKKKRTHNRSPFTEKSMPYWDDCVYRIASQLHCADDVPVL